MTAHTRLLKNGSTNAHRIEKEFVHKNFSENVFISSIEAASDRIFKVNVLFPTNHCLYNDQISGLSASTYVVELARQSNIAICHLFFNVNLDVTFTIISIDLNFLDKKPYLPKYSEPFLYTVEFAAYKKRKDFLIAKTVSNLFQSGEEVANGKSTFLITANTIDKNNKELKTTVRKNKLRAVTPDLVQVKHAENALITHPEYDDKNQTMRSRMIVDVNHKYFYEHPCAHIPGMMMLEAGRQLAICGLKAKFDFLKNTYGDLKEGDIAFSKFATAHSDVFIEIKAQAPNMQEGCAHVPVSITYHQHGQPLGSFEGIVAFMNLTEAVEKSIYASMYSQDFRIRVL